jgi:hypothetical protein
MYWQDVEASLMRENLQVAFDHNDSNNNFKQKDDQRILIGNNPFGANYSELVLLQFFPAKKGTTSTISNTAAMVEVGMMNIPQVQEYQSLEEWLRQTAILTFTEYLELLWSTYLHEILDINTYTLINDD